MNDKFILKRKRKEYKQNVKYPKISVENEVYRTLEDWAAETGLSLSEITKQAVMFCKEHLVFVEE